MLVSRHEGGLHLIRHPDHAVLAGAMADAWGAPGFDRSARHESLVCAATRHDDGWAELDAAPLIADKVVRPAHFLEVPLVQTIEPYRAGIERIYEDDIYAGILASRHWAGLYSARWGVQNSPFVPHPAAIEISRTEDDRAASEARQLWQSDPAVLRSALEAGLWRDYETLQALDLLSLALCLMDTATATGPDAPDVPVPATLPSIDQPAGGRVVPNVPRGTEHVALRLRVLSAGVVAVDPFPFRQDHLTVSIPMRVLAQDEFASAEAAAAAYADAPTTKLDITLTAADGAAGR